MLLTLGHTWAKGFAHGFRDVSVLSAKDVYVELFMVIYGYLWLFMVIYGCLWLFMVVYGYSRLIF